MDRRASSRTGAPAHGLTQASALREEDVALAQRGDGPAVDRLMRAAIPRIQAQLQRYPLTPEDRLDALQTTLLALWRSLPTYRAESRFSTWLYRVAANEALMSMRRARRARGTQVEDAVLEEVSHGPAADEATEGAQAKARLLAAIAELPRGQREVLVAYYAEGRQMQEIADRFLLSERAVRARVHRARVALRERLERAA